jgi:hypothetical protein
LRACAPTSTSIQFKSRASECSLGCIDYFFKDLKMNSIHESAIEPLDGSLIDFDQPLLKAISAPSSGSGLRAFNDTATSYTTPIFLFDINHPLLQAINAPKNAGGLLQAAVSIKRAVHAAAELMPSPRASDLVQEASSLLAQIEKMRSQIPAISAPDGRDTGRPIYCHFVAPAPCMASKVQLTRINAMLGLALCVAVTQHCALNAEFLDLLQTLRRALDGKGRRHEDWDTLAQDLPVLTDEILATLAKVSQDGVKRLLSDLYRMQQVVLALPSENTEARKFSAEMNIAPRHGNTQEEGISDEEDFGNDTLDSKAERELEAPAFIHHHIIRALYSRYPEKMGVIHADHLPLNEMQTVCKGIVIALKGDSEQNSIFASAAICSAVTHLNIKLAMRVPLNTNEDQYIDIDKGLLISGYAQFTQSAPPTKAEEWGSGNIVVPFPEEVGPVWKKLAAMHPEAKNLGQLHGVPTEFFARRAWLKAYGLFLRGLGSEAFPPYSARFSNSLSPIYLAVGKEDVYSSLLNFAVPSSTQGMAHYAYISRERIETLCKEVYSFAGWGKPFALPAAYKGCGSTKTITARAFTEGWRGLISEIAALRAKLKVQRTEEEYLALLNQLNGHTLSAIVILTAHRATRLDRLTLGSLYSHGDLLYLFDKESGSTAQSRLIAKTDLVTVLLDGYLQDLKHFRKVAKRLGWVCSSQAMVTDGPLRYNRPAFIKYEIKVVFTGDHKVARRRFITSDVEVVTQKYFQAPANFARHYWVTTLCELQTNRWLIRLLTGHFRQDAGVFHEYGLVSPEAAIKSLGAAMEAVIGNLNLLPPPNTKSGSQRGDLPTFAVWVMPGKQQAADQGISGLGRNHQSKSTELFSARTLSSIHIVDTVLDRLVKHERPECLDAAFLLHLATFNGCSRYDDLVTIFSDEDDSLFQIDGNPVVSFVRQPSGQRITIPLLPPTRVFLKESGYVVHPVNFIDAIEKAARWLRESIPAGSWPATDKACIDALLKCVVNWQNYRLPPACVTLYSQDMPASTLSTHSVIRLTSPAINAPNVNTAQWVPTVKLKHLPKNQDLSELQRCLGWWADTSKCLGGNLARAKQLQVELSRLPRSLAGSACDYLKRGLFREVQKIIANDKGARELSGLATYFSTIKPLFESISPTESLDEYQADDWEQLFLRAKDLQSVEQTKHGLTPEADASESMAALKRFLKTISETGVDIPSYLYLNQNEKQDFSRHAASSIYISVEDLERIRDNAAKVLADWPLEAKRVDLMLKVMPECLMRYGECATLPLQCCLPDSGFVVIEEQGFSNLKSNAAHRLSSASPSTIAAIEKLSVELLNADSNHKFLFLDNAEVVTLEANEQARLLITELLQQATDDNGARLHSLKGYGVNRRLFPKWEEVAKGLFAGQAGPLQCGELFDADVESWTRLAKTSCEAAHASMFRTATSYWSSWVFIRTAAFCAALSTFPPPPATERLIGLAEGSCRQARSRHKASSTQPFDAWPWLGAHCTFQTWPVLKAEGPAALPNSHGSPEIETRGADQRNGIIKYVAKRLLGASLAEAQTQYQLSSSRVAQLELNLPDSEAVTELRKRIKGNALGRAVDADLREIDKTDATVVIDDRLHGPLENDSLLLKVLCGKPLDKGSNWDEADTCAEVLDKCLASMSVHLALEVCFGSRYQQSDISARLASNPRLLVIAPQRDVAKIPKVHVIYAAPDSRTAVSKARLTTLMRVLLTAVQHVSNNNKEV